MQQQLANNNTIWRLTGAPFTSGSTGARAPLEILRNDPHKYNLSKYPNFIGNLNLLVLNYFMSYVMTWNNLIQKDLNFL